MSESLDDIMSGKGADAPAQDDTQRQETERTPERNRDESGRFAAQPQPEEPSEKPQTEVQPQAEPQTQPPPGYIPVQALDARLAKADERYYSLEAQLRARDAQMQQMLASMQPKQPAAPPPDFFEDPDKAFQYRVQQAIDPLVQGQQGLVERFSRMMAVKDYGDDTVRAAFGDLEKRVQLDPQANRPLYLRIMQAEHPYGELVRWHKEQTALSTYGDDPAAFEQQLRQKILAEMQAGNGGGHVQPQTQHPAQPATPMPQSFTQATNGGPRTTPQWQGPTPLSELMPR